MNQLLWCAIILNLPVVLHSLISSVDKPNAVKQQKETDGTTKASWNGKERQNKHELNMPKGAEAVNNK